MEAHFVQSISPASWLDTDNFVKKPGGLLCVSRGSKKQQRLRMSISTKLSNRIAPRHKSVILEVSGSYKDTRASVLETGGFPASLDEALILKNKSLEIEPYMNGRSIYLVGMMGSGKTTVGRIISDVLGYSFFDSDAIVEQEIGGISVADIFKQYGECFFRDYETKALQRLSSMQKLVVSTGGGAVVRPVNWKYMRRGISVWLDVPLEALARRIAAVGTNSRPLLHQESDDVFSKTYKRLSTIMAERGEAYANANARVSLDYIAAKLGYVDVDNLTPAAIAIEALEQIESYLKEDGFAI